MMACTPSASATTESMSTTGSLGPTVTDPPAASPGRVPFGRHVRGDELDRLARSLPDARDILDELTRRNVKLSLGGSIHDPTDPVGRLLFNVLAMVAEFESDLIRMRTREGMKIAKAKGRLKGKQPKLKPNQAKHLLELHDLGTYTQAELAELFGVGRSTIYRTLERTRPTPPEPERPFAHLVNQTRTSRE